jgi:thioredoxin-like negative regulator of GroEL
MLVLAAGCRQESAPVQLVPADLTLVRETLAEFNHGAALMERYDYAGAAKSFALVVERQPDWTAAKFNLALAQLNLMGESGAQDNLDAARQGFESILAADPKHLHARFCLGMYYQHVGDIEKTVDCFRAVYDADPDESYVGYKYAEALRSAGRQDEALPILEKVVERDPGFISAIYQLANVYNRTSQREKALPLFERFKQLQAVELTVGSYVVQASYGMAGKYYRVLAADNLPLPASPSGTTTRIVFSPETKPLGAATKAWKWRGGTIGLPGMAAADVDADGDLDLCLTATGDKGAASIWQNDGKGSFVACGEFADQAVSPCFGDVDNDGDVDLWLGRAGTDLLLLNDGKGQFAPDANAALAGPDALTHTARLFDLDSDGDLDFLALRMAKGNVPAAADSAPAACSLFSSNGDGSFTDQAAELGLELRDQAVNTFLCDDFDNDLDPDLVVFPAAGPPIAWVNSRLGKYRWLQSADSGLTVEGVRSASTGDPDKDGNRDLLVFSAAGVQLWKNDGHFRFQADQDFNTRFGALRGTGGQFADIDNDGDLDIFIADAHRRDGSRGPVLLVNSWPAGGFVDAGEADAGSLFNAIRTEGNASCVVADFTGDGRCDVLLAAIGQKPVLIENATQGGHWIELDLVGKRPQDNKSRSSNSAIGARVDVKTGTVFQQFMVGCSSGPVASPPLRIHAGLGDNPTVDWLRIIWPDASLQAEVELAADRVHSVEEISRKPSSCPYLFAWNGERFEFVADFGGVGGLGYLLAPGQYAAPDPTEYIRIPQLQPHGDEYVLQSLTPLEEVTYFDEAKLIAVDHPQNTEVYPHEMMAVGVPPPPFELFCIRADQRIDPVRAVDHRGADVTDDVRTIDRRYAGATSPDPRFVGLAEEHAVELDFGDRLAKLPAKARLVLLLHGWVEYGYSATNFAASQAGLHARAPTI